MSLRNSQKGHKLQKNRKNRKRRRRKSRWLKKKLKKQEKKRPKKEEEEFSRITKLMKRSLRGCFPSARDVDQATSWLIMAIVTPVDIAVSRGTSKLKRASDTYLTLETSIALELGR